MTCSCTICDRQFRLPRFMKPHMIRVHNLQIDCTSCKQWFPNDHEFEKHFEKSNQCKKPNLECSLCGLLFIRKELLFKHHKTHRGLPEYKCRTCGDTFAKMTQLYSHSRYHEVPEHMCPHCGYRAKDRSNVDRHMRTVHITEKKFSCEICNKRFKTDYYLKKHIEFRHTEREPLNLLCPICSAVYNSDAGLQFHMKKHTKDYPYECHLCVYKSAWKNTYENHVASNHPYQNPYACNQCSDTFEVETDLRDHLRDMHGRLDLSKDRFTCHACSRSFVFKRQLEIHALGHEKTLRYKCTLCYGRFKTQHNLDEHVAEKHPDGKALTYDCVKCGQGFRAKNKLARHMATVHTIGKNVKCTENGCPKAFKTKEDLRLHIKRMHRVVEKNFACTYMECDKVFAKLQNLKVHLRVHSGEKPYHCPHCNYSCGFSGNLTKHIRQVHEK